MQLKTHLCYYLLKNKGQSVCACHFSFKLKKNIFYLKSSRFIHYDSVNFYFVSHFLKYLLPLFDLCN